MHPGEVPQASSSSGEQASTSSGDIKQECYMSGFIYATPRSSSFLTGEDLRKFKEVQSRCEAYESPKPETHKLGSWKFTIKDELPASAPFQLSQKELNVLKDFQRWLERPPLGRAVRTSMSTAPFQRRHREVLRPLDSCPRR